MTAVPVEPVAEDLPPTDDLCNHPDCGQIDKHPKYRLYVGVREVDLGEAFGGTKKICHEHDTDGDGWLDYHHDCAASLKHLIGDAADHAQIIVDHSMVDDGAGGKRQLKGDELKAMLTDTSHPVHAAIQAANDANYTPRAGADTAEAGA